MQNSAHVLQNDPIWVVSKPLQEDKKPQFETGQANPVRAKPPQRKDTPFCAYIL